MNQALFNISLEESMQALKDFKIFRSKGVKSINGDGVSPEFKSFSQRKKYKETFLAGLRNYDYDVLLNDQSYFQFQFNKKNKYVELRYAYFQNPFSFKSYELFLKEEVIAKGYGDSVDEIGDLFQLEYQQFLEEQEAIETYTTIRYDSEPMGYKPLVHSASHLHIGYRNNIRIPLNKIITPLKFVLFVIKHVYYPNWKNMANDDISYIEKKLLQARLNCLDLNVSQWEAAEKLDLHIM